MKLAPALIATLALNAALLAALALRPSLAPTRWQPLFALASSSTSVTPPPTAPSSAASSTSGTFAAPPVIRWSSLQTDDLRALIARLHAAGFPPLIVRAIVTAEVDARFAPRLHELHGTTEPRPFWKPDPSPFGDPKKSELHAQISRERSRLLRELLGDDFSADRSDPTAQQRRRYGDLPAAKIAALEQIEADYAEMLSQLRSATEGIRLPEDREKFTLLEREKQADLAALLSPAEREVYEMRTSSLTSNLAQAMTLMDATEAEFRAIYQVRKAHDERLRAQRVSDAVAAGAYSGDAASPVLQRLAAELEAALGAARYADYARAGSFEYQQLASIGARENIPVETLHRAFAVRDNASRESNRIHADSALSLDEKRAALAALAQQTRTRILSTLGPAAGPAYVDVASWLLLVERGFAVTFGPENTMSTRRLVEPRPRP